uniref:BED-type domain-containing protein n=1 Tax=Octopus bimaculoides TaxID=37653 RepID=A0A0L8HX16_OCTBM
MIKRKSNKDEAQCNKCDKIMKSSGGSTTSLILHLKKIHQIDINQDANQPPVKMTRTMEHFLTKKSMEEVSKLAAMDGFSFNSIAKSDFIQRNLHSQRSKYDKLQPTSANGVRNMVINYYITKKEERK